MAQKEAENPSDLRIALVGKTGVGKSAVGNTILGRRVFKSEVSLSSVTSKCQKENEDVDSKTVAVVDTPGLYDTNREMKDVITEVGRAVNFASPGPHVFLIVIQLTRFSKEEQETVKILQEMFGEEARKYSMVLFTHGDEIERANADIETVISGNQPLRDFISQCGGGYYVFNNINTENRVQVTELLKKIKKLVQINGGRCFTNAMFQAAEKAIREVMKRLLRKNPKMDPKEARKRAEKDNSFIQDAVGLGITGAIAGAAAGAEAGAALGAAAGPVGAVVGGLVGAGVGVAAAVLINKKGCSIQ